MKSKKRLSDEERRKRANDATKKWQAANKDAVKATRKKWIKANKQKISGYNCKYKANHPDRVKERRRDWRQKNWASHTASNIRWRAKRLVKLAGRKKPKLCDVCKRGGRRLHYDHDHKTGLFRGWLCYGCNLVLGGVNDSPGLLRKLADYLEVHKTKVVNHKDLRIMAQKAYAIAEAAKVNKMAAHREKKSNAAKIRRQEERIGAYFARCV